MHAWQTNLITTSLFSRYFFLMNGLLCLYKPAGITSYDCIRHLKRILPKKTKIGHGGTLDPFAEGLLVIGIGKGTKQLNDLLGATKTYVVTAKLGELTDTLDLTGSIIEHQPIPEGFNFYACAQKLMPSYEQTPPIFSSIKLNGTSLHKLARTASLSHEELEKVTESRKKVCTIFDFHMLGEEPPFASFSATVSKGTYIRSLALDIAREGKTVATVHALKRSAIGNLCLEDAVKLENLTNCDDIIAHFLKKALHLSN